MQKSENKQRFIWHLSSSWHWSHGEQLSSKSLFHTANEKTVVSCLGSSEIKVTLNKLGEIKRKIGRYVVCLRRANKARLLRIRCYLIRLHRIDSQLLVLVFVISYQQSGDAFRPKLFCEFGSEYVNVKRLI